MGGVASYHRDDKNRITHIVDPLGQTTEQAWDNNNLVAVTNPLGEGNKGQAHFSL